MTFPPSRPPRAIIHTTAAEAVFQGRNGRGGSHIPNGEDLHGSGDQIQRFRGERSLVLKIPEIIEIKNQEFSVHRLISTFDLPNNKYIYMGD